MPVFVSIRFVVRRPRPRRGSSDSGVLPVVGGASLRDLIAGFERKRGFDVPGEYGALAHHPGPLLAHYLGETGDECCGGGRTELLGCTCGEPGCWPLCCRIQLSRDTVIWSDFAQPFRRERDYDGFGPFVFDRREYEEALAALARDVRS